jgi:mediator of RNA polymerase II transcription subunit 31
MAESTTTTTTTTTDRKSDVNFGVQLLDGFAVDVSHQEIERVVVELEELYKSQPGEWLPVDGISRYVAEELGYEDIDEFEDALKCDFKTFISKLPHVECANVESALEPGKWRECFKVTTAAASDGGDGSVARPRRMILKIQSKDDLWRVFMKSPNTEIEIPEIDFYIGADSKRCVDSVYNHVASAVFNLETHVSHMASSAENEEEKKGIVDTCDKLRQLLDLDGSFTLVVIDKEGTCAFKPSEGVVVEPL